MPGALWLFAICLTLLATPAAAQDTRVMPLPQVKNILKITGDNWIVFRDFNSRQLIYFTHLISWKCGIREIQYSLNNDSLSERFPVPECNKLLPNNIGANDKILLERKLNSVTSVAVRLLFDDDTTSATNIYRPCPGAGEASCAQRVESRE
jgi:hypothetical protein